MRSKRDSWSGVDPRRDPGFIRARDLAVKDPKNLTSLPDDMKAKWEEEKYRRALKWKWGRMQGDPLLKSMKPDGMTKEGFFGDAVKTDVNEEDEP